jgi:hypothetical protein
MGGRQFSHSETEIIRMVPRDGQLLSEGAGNSLGRHEKSPTACSNQKFADIEDSGKIPRTFIRLGCELGPPLTLSNA